MLHAALNYFASSVQPYSYQVQSVVCVASCSRSLRQIVWLDFSLVSLNDIPSDNGISRTCFIVSCMTTAAVLIGCYEYLSYGLAFFLKGFRRGNFGHMSRCGRRYLCIVTLTSECMSKALPFFEICESGSKDLRESPYRY
eukprot:2397224-Pyramimonas_sp.AAC.2